MKRILVIEDERIAARIVTNMCDTHGWYSEVAHNLTDGLHLLAVAHFDCCLLDLCLPESDWHETIKRVRAVSQVPIVVMTAKDHDPNIELEAIRQGANEFLNKAPSLDMLNFERMVNRAIERVKVQH